MLWSTVLVLGYKLADRKLSTLGARLCMGSHSTSLLTGSSVLLVLGHAWAPIVQAC